MVQAFAYRRLVAANEPKAAVLKRSAVTPSAKALGAPPVEMPARGAARLPVGMPALD